MARSEGQTYNLEHPLLGQMKGRLISSKFGNDIVQFRSVPYAKVPARFKAAVSLDHLPENFDSRAFRDFTDYGAACPQVGASGDAWFDSHGGREADDFGLTFDDLTCTTLSIAVPKSILERPEASSLPVMVYVHGGGLSEGIGHVDGIHSTVNITGLALQESTPVITITVGYRLGWFGFLACEDLLKEYETSSSQDPFNLGIYDQRLAFQWVLRHISGFGGNPQDVTAFAESAGSISLIYHMASDVPLFHRAILQSGVPFGYSSLESKDANYHALLADLNINATTAQERLSQLRNKPAEKLILSPVAQKAGWILPMVFEKHTPNLFPRGIPSNTNAYQLVKSCPWVSNLIIGEDHFEGHTVMPLLKAAKPDKVLNAICKTVGPDLFAPIAQYYDITPDMDQVLFWSQLSLLWGDIFLSEPMQRLADIVAEPPSSSDTDTKEGTRRKKVYRYHFALVNPIPGSHHYMVPGHHFVEILYIFLNLLDRFPKSRDGFYRRQSLETARRWIAFANGKEPWAEYVPVSKGGEGILAICDEAEGWVERSRELDLRISRESVLGERRYEGWERIRKFFECLEKEGEGKGVDIVNEVRKTMCDVGPWI